MILKNIAFLALLAFACIAATPAFATKTVTSPYVTKDRATVEWRGGYEMEDGDEDTFKTRNQFAYGLTDFYEAKISVDTRDDDNGTFSDFDVENKFQLFTAEEGGIDVGLRLDYTRSLNGSEDEVGTKLLFGNKTGGFTQLLNLEAGTELGDDAFDEWAYGFAYGISYPVLEELALGAEWYSDFGDFEGDFDEQGHMAGPVIYGTAFDKIKYQTGVLAGISDAAPDAMLKATIGYSFNF